jgi:phage terminase large subunit-like protein
MNNQPEPVVLDLAALPREKMGPFLVLGVEKDAAREQIEASWARRLIAARKNQLRVTLEDVNWAKELISDADRRVRADATSLNLDLIDGFLRRIARKYAGAQSGARPTWRPVDDEQQPPSTTSTVELPDWRSVRDSIIVPEIPEEAPAVPMILARLADEAIDPWNVGEPCS